MADENFTSIYVEKEVRDRIKNYGVMGDSCNDVLKKLMDIADKYNKMVKK